MGRQLGAVVLLHLLDKVCGSEEESFEAFFNVLIVECMELIEDEFLEVFLDMVCVVSQVSDEVVLCECDIEFFSEGPDLQ